MIKSHRHQVVYHLYPKSFQDTNGDGVGDLNGIRKRLDYLQRLGVDMIWLCPVYTSPGYDHGYGVADYTSIDPLYGSMDEMEALIDEASRHDITIMMDIVANHTSSCHKWFIASEHDPDGPYGDTYIWRDEPTEVESFFGGSAWTYSSIRQQYYFHSFAKEQPDLNWNQPIVAKEFARILSFWIEKGVRGFRFDVIDLIGKQIHPHRWLNFERVQEGLREMLAPVDRSNLLLVGEAGGLSPSEIRQLQEERLLDVVFNFETCALDEVAGKSKWHLQSFDPAELKMTIKKWQDEMKEDGWNSLFWNNHDQPRVLSRWYDDDIRAAKMLALLQLTLRGTPFIYQGDEIGMTNGNIQQSDYQDIETLRYLQQGGAIQSVQLKGRDHARLPMMWTKEGGFSTGSAWLQAMIDADRNVHDQQLDDDSLLQVYRRLLSIRKTEPALLDGEMRWQETPSTMIAFDRIHGEQSLRILVNLSNHSIRHRIKMGKTLIGVGDYCEEELGPYAAVLCYTF